MRFCVWFGLRGGCSGVAFIFAVGQTGWISCNRGSLGEKNIKEHKRENKHEKKGPGHLLSRFPSLPRLAAFSPLGLGNTLAA